MHFILITYHLATRKLEHYLLAALQFDVRRSSECTECCPSLRLAGLIVHCPVAPLGSIFRSHKHDHAAVQDTQSKLAGLSVSTEGQTVPDHDQEPLQASPLSMNQPSSSLHYALNQENDSAHSSILLSRNDTQSTTGSLPSNVSSTSSKKSKVPHQLSKYRDPGPWVLPPHLEPVQLVELAISTLYTIPGPPIEELRNFILPQMFHVSALEYRVNCRETDFFGMVKGVEMLRSRFVVCGETWMCVDGAIVTDAMAPLSELTPPLQKSSD